MYTWSSSTCIIVYRQRMKMLNRHGLLANVHFQFSPYIFVLYVMYLKRDTEYTWLIVLTWKVRGATSLCITSVRQKANMSSTTSLPYMPDITVHRYMLKILLHCIKWFSVIPFTSNYIYLKEIHCCNKETELNYIKKNVVSDRLHYRQV